MTIDKTFLTALLIMAIIATLSFSFGLITFNNHILFLTFLALVWYAWETKRLREEAVLQTELKTMPIMSMYVRNISNIKNEEKKRNLNEKYAITHEIDSGIRSSGYYIALRNVGDGPSFNVSVESNNFKIERYQTKFFAPEPKGDEHAIKIIKKPNNKIRKLEELKDEIFIIKCESVIGKVYEYKYKVKNIDDKMIEFIK